MHKKLRGGVATVMAMALAVNFQGIAHSQESNSPARSTANTAEMAEAEAAERAYDIAATPTAGREGLEPAEEGFNDNNIDNDAGVNWEPTEDPESEVTPGEMRSDSEEIPGGFTKEEADRAETQEAEEQSAADGIGILATPTNCRTYWPSPFKVCGKIREKYDAIGGPTSFLTWPRSDEMGVPDGVGRRNEFVNGFIYWHPTHGAHPITTHFSLAYDRNGWEAGGLGYPTSDEFATPNGIGRKQEFANGAIYGSPAGLAAVQGLIYDKYVSLGASEGVLGFPTADEAASNGGGNGRYSIFTGGRIYWHPTHGAHPVLGDILEQWAESGYAGGAWGYPTGDPEPGSAGWFSQAFENRDHIGRIDGDPTDGAFSFPYIPFDSLEEAIAYFQPMATGVTPNSATTQRIQPAATVEEYGPCVLEPQNIHLRSSSNNTTIGFKSLTTCDHPVTSIHHETRLMYKYYLNWNEAASRTNSRNTGKARLYTENLERDCGEKDVWTNFAGETNGTIEWNGKTYYSYVRPPFARLECRME